MAFYPLFARCNQCITQTKKLYFYHFSYQYKCQFNYSINSRCMSLLSAYNNTTNHVYPNQLPINSLVCKNQSMASNCTMMRNSNALIGSRFIQLKSGLNDEASLLAPQNEIILDYKSDPKCEHRFKLEQALIELRSKCHEIPIIINGKRYDPSSSDWQFQSIPFEHESKIAKFKYATPELITEAFEVAQSTRCDWNNSWSLENRIELFELAANLAKSDKYRFKLNAATMLGQAKTIDQAEIDSAAELVDFLTFNAYYAKKLLQFAQPIHSNPNKFIQNSTNFRPLDGFVGSISPFNFTAIGANLASAPTLMGNCVVWKPSDQSILSNYITMQLFEEAGFPNGVINFVPADGFTFGRQLTSSDELAGINFTGSLQTFRWLWNEVGLNIRRYNNFPRLSGECGGKNFHFVHESANPELVLEKTISSAFDYSGQKCSACSRLYVPASLWSGRANIRAKLIDFVNNQLKLGPATDLDNTNLSAVCDSKAFLKCQQYLQFAKEHSNEMKILCGGNGNKSIGYYIEPTVIECKNPKNRLMEEEIFGPILSVYVYPDGQALETMDLIDDCRYALTGSIFAQDSNFIKLAKKRLSMAAGNFYINDKSTGAIVGQQPFGGARLSGTNDKAGGPFNLIRWTNLQTIKQNLDQIPLNVN